MKEIIKTFRSLTIAMISIVVAIAADTVIKSVLPEYAELRKSADENPILWILLGVAVAALLTYIGHKSTEEEVKKLEKTCELQSTRIAELEEVLTEERRRRGVDPLTGLPNQFRFETELDELISVDEKRSSFTLIYIDLFGLKIVNDTQGDEYGSRYIQSCVKLISDAMYRKEKIFRIGAGADFSISSAEIYRSRDGGDEFYLLLGADEIGALFAVKRVLADLISAKNNLLSTSQNPLAKPLKMKVGFRGGVVELADYETRAALVQEAKAAQLHTRLGDLPDAPSRYIVTGTPPDKLSEISKKILGEIDELIDGQN